VKGTNLRRTRVAAAATAAFVATALALPLTTQSGASAAPGAAAAHRDGAKTTLSDDRAPAWRAKYDDLRQQAVQQRLRTGGKGAVEKLGRRTYARVAQTGTDRIFVVLAEFGDTRHSAIPDDPDSGAQRFDGPLHNQIPKPDRKVDNSTLWQKNYDRAYFKNLYFSRMKKFYSEQSSGRYTVAGDVTE
jgi:immune inhibitor A